MGGGGLGSQSRGSLHEGQEQRRERAPRVLHVAQPTTGGVAVYVAQAAADQRRRGWDVAVACPDPSPLAERLSAGGVPVIGWSAGRSPNARTPAEARRLRRIVNGFAPDVVHLHSAKAGLAGRLAGGGRERPHGLIFQPHGWSWLAGGSLLARISKIWERAAAARCDALVCVGEGELEQGRDAGVRGRLLVVRNGVDLDRFRAADGAARQAARRALGVPADTALAVCLGRHSRQKGQDVLLEAWPAVSARCPRARLALVGDADGNGRGGAAARPLNDTIATFPATDDPRPWLAAADVVVMPSRWEGLPLVALEALATGRSVVGTRIPGLTEVVPAGAGRLVPAGAPQPLADAVAERLLDPGLADAEGAEAARLAAAFDLTGTLERLAALTATVASRSSATATP
ncbi:glycosyltransferase family 4 protein [Spirillospora sp. NPDC047279]|uniref:glycosyltransferase family 4 protein n=1 Tax=Spirillospora sp. NPDC047279 TaxID=3155478 RepID=UPI0033E43E9C